MTEQTESPLAAHGLATRVHPSAKRPRDPKGRLMAKSSSPLSDAPPEPEVAEAPAKQTRRSNRRPLGRREAKLAYPARDGYQRRWINDEPGRVALALQGGYAHVEENGKPVCQHVGTVKAGSGLNAFLMEIPQEFYDEDFAEKQAGLDETDRQLYGGSFNEQPGDMRVNNLGKLRGPNGQSIINMSVRRGATR